MCENGGFSLSGSHIYNCKTHIVTAKQCQNKLANESTEATSTSYS